MRIDPQDWAFDAPEHLSLLEAAATAGIRLARSCRNGTCRACICRLTAGQVRYRIDWPGLSREEKDAGWILPCVACAASDLAITAPNAQRTGT